MSARADILDALVAKIKESITSVNTKNISDRAIFWDEINDFPFISVVLGVEEREYLPANFKWGYLNIKIRVYVDDEYAQKVLETVIEEIETILDNNNSLQYRAGKSTELISIINITTDEGVLHPIGVGEILIVIQYAIE